MLSELTLSYALSFLGVPYKWAGQSPGGVDCSGFVVMVLQSNGKLPNKFDASSQGLFNYFKINMAKEIARPSRGCLAFYGKSKEKITHIALCLSDNQLIEAAGGNSTTLTRADAEKRGAHVRIRPIGYRKDLVAYLDIDIDVERIIPIGSRRK